jgi:hypothetical protein
MKTNDRSCKIGEKQTDFCAEMTRILQKKAAFSCFLSVGNAFWRKKLPNLQGGLAGYRYVRLYPLAGCGKTPPSCHSDPALREKNLGSCKIKQLQGSFVLRRLMDSSG